MQTTKKHPVQISQTHPDGERDVLPSSGSVRGVEGTDAKRTDCAAICQPVAAAGGWVLRGGPVWLVVVLLTLSTFFTGCTPAGPRAVLNGKALLDRGEYLQAIEPLRTATRLMPTNALAFNYLGLALHQAGQTAEAERAYLRALALDHDLSEVHYDLGCLLLSQSNKLDQAKSELIAYTMRRPNSAEGWLKLGQAQLRSRELTAAERSLEESLRLDSHNPEAWTTIGLVRCQRKRPAEAIQFFAKALKEDPNYAPALLNSAIVEQQELNDPRSALQKYRQYAALKPAPENVGAVRGLIQQLEQQLYPPAPEPTPSPAPQPTIATVPKPSPPPEPTHSPNVAKSPLPTNATHAASTSRPEPAPTLPKATVSVPSSAKAPVSNPAPSETIETVRLPAEPVIKPAEDLAAAPAASRSEAAPAPQDKTPDVPVSTDGKQQKRGFFHRINPINLFAHDAKPPEPQPFASLPASAPTPANTVSSNPEQARHAETLNFRRYSYRSPARPEPGNRAAAQQAFAEGVQQQQGQRFSEAVQSYRRATQLDPSFYDAQYNLGLAATESGNLSLALSAYELALALEPESLDARYNFGLVLRQAGYPLDALAQFQRILEHFPNDGRTHLALGNLYAQQLQEPAKARQHYLAALAIAPQSQQAGAIRYWLTDHPR